MPHVTVRQSHGPLSWTAGQLDNASLPHAHLMRRLILLSDQSVVTLGRPPLPYLTVGIPRPLLRVEAPMLMAITTSIR